MPSRKVLSYEEQRLLQIAKNEQVLRDLGLTQASKKIKTTYKEGLEWHSKIKKEQKKLRLQRKRQLAKERATAPRRKSRRQAGLHANGQMCK